MRKRILTIIIVVLGLASMFALCAMTSDAGKFSPDEVNAMADKDLRASGENEELSSMWKAYCDKYGVDYYAPTDKELNRYLEVYCESDEAQEAALEYEQNK